MASTKKKKDTIDSKYHQQLKDFDHPNFQAIKDELQLKKDRLGVLKANDLTDLTDLELNELALLKLRIPELEKELATDHGHSELTKYFMEVGHTLSDYYQALETRNDDLPSFAEIVKGEASADNTVKRISEIYNAKVDPIHHYELEEHEVHNICPRCNIEMEVNTLEGLVICPQCDDSMEIVIHTDKPSYNESPCDNIYFSYQRINHFREKLAEIQQREHFKIPRAIEEKLCEMFHKIQEPFIKHRPADKVNFTSYNYVINKCLHIIKHPEYAKYFPLLKSKENLYKADKFWKKICAELKLPFYPSH